MADGSWVSFYIKHGEKNYLFSNKIVFFSCKQLLNYIFFY